MSRLLFVARFFNFWETTSMNERRPERNLILDHIQRIFDKQEFLISELNGVRDPFHELSMGNKENEYLNMSRITDHTRNYPNNEVVDRLYTELYKVLEGYEQPTRIVSSCILL